MVDTNLSQAKLDPLINYGELKITLPFNSMKFKDDQVVSLIGKMGSNECHSLQCQQPTNWKSEGSNRKIMKIFIKFRPQNKSYADSFLLVIEGIDGGWSLHILNIYRACLANAFSLASQLWQHGSALNQLNLPHARIVKDLYAGRAASGAQVQLVQTVMHLEMHLDSKLKWKQHTQEQYQEIWFPTE